MAELWEKQEWETYGSYKRFCIYRDIGITRSLRKVCDYLKRPDNYMRALQLASSKYKWKERADAYDMHLEEENRKENEVEIKEMRKRHIQQALMMQKNVIAKIQSVNPNEMSLSDCIKMFETAAKIERLSRDCDSPKIELNNKVVVDTKEILEQKKLENLTPEELEELENLMRKMNGEEEK